MKFVPSQLAYLTTDREARTNLWALGKYLLFLAGLATLYSVLFHVIKLNVEREQHSWIDVGYLPPTSSGQLSTIRTARGDGPSSAGRTRRKRPPFGSTS